MTDQRLVAVIPARGGSKRLPRKNLLPFAGKPLLQWTIEAAQRSAAFHEIVLSSDDEEILSLGRKLGVTAVQRPAQLAADDTSTIDVLRHLIDYFQRHGSKTFDALCLLQPTSPLRDSTDIQNAIKKFYAVNAESLISVCQVDHSPLWCNTLEGDERMDNFLSSEIINKRSQDLPTYYRLNGAIYVSTLENILKHGSFFTENSYAFKMSREKSIDIDDEMDFIVAETLFKKAFTE